MLPVHCMDELLLLSTHLRFVMHANCYRSQIVYRKIAGKSSDFMIY
ncbi:hypothetical protein RUMHYD_03809 [Blautia hydrogenotrophica DSM 10507]|uniref:Uncharacterized protein n=1 Tax=Blautia hydrogenotrophica (strain DSM 10507 / JCM 14656 / S5a33) TaxID=476272 RepID=C0CSE2_BLAHS|nr:hypothetical protein RUMHYD_03809 [Blautia hydrogenotrophica DSM 10507]